MAVPPPRPAAAARPNTFAAQPTAVKAAAAIVFAVLPAVGYYVMFHTPLQEQIQAAHSEHGTLEGQLRNAETRQREFIQLRSELASRETLDQTHLRVLPEQAEFAAFLEDLNQLAETSGLELRVVEPRPEVPGEHYVRLPVHLQLVGRYHQLIRFFYNVSRLERAISMENIELSDPEEVESSVVLQVDVLATTYRRPDQPPPAPARPQPRASQTHARPGS